MLGEPRLLLLDEADANLDHRTADVIGRVEDARWFRAPLVEQIAALGVELNANQYKVVRLAAEYDTTLEWFHDG